MRCLIWKDAAFLLQFTLGLMTVFSAAVAQEKDVCTGAEMVSYANLSSRIVPQEVVVDARIPWLRQIIYRRKRGRPASMAAGRKQESNCIFSTPARHPKKS